MSHPISLLFDSHLNPDGGGIENEFDDQDVDGDIVIYDAATKLTWQGGSELPPMLYWQQAQASVDALKYAGFDDWRLPTLKEAMSLMEPKSKHGLYIDPVFGKKEEWIWTSDKWTASLAWGINFIFGGCYYPDSIIDNVYYVRAVR